jgi:aspartyl-tRNA(Asn)/glutamyl-tRNA(Gln) amidotransferase subunit B
MKTTPIIGLEVHVELKTKSKMFCGCDATHFHVEPNTHTCPVCLGLPGALPVPNKVACEWCVKIGLSLNCSINEHSFFERKNYFYPDLAKGYQITQLQKPFAVHGYIDIDDQKIRINRAHMEEDTGKSVHMNIQGEDATLLDFNRSGVPLVEIVSEPDISSPEVAKKYLVSLQRLIRYLGVSDADIEEGSMRCEPTINVKIETDDGQTIYTPLAEIKNVASLSGVQTAIEYEVNRQIEEWKQTGVVANKTNKTTRGWDADRQSTFLQREKEGSADYRYFPEPDIPPMEFSSTEIEQIRSTLPLLPHQKISRYQELGLSPIDSITIADDKSFSDIFDAVIGFGSTDSAYTKFVANLFLGAIKTYLNETGSELDAEKVNPDHFHQIYTAIQNSEISSTVAKQLIIESYTSSRPPLEIAKEKGLLQVSDTKAIEEIAQKVIADNPKAVEDYKKNPLSIGFLIGQLMRSSGGSANPKLAKEVLEKLLN